MIFKFGSNGDVACAIEKGCQIQSRCLSFGGASAGESLSGDSAEACERCGEGKRGHQKSSVLDTMMSRRNE